MVFMFYYDNIYTKSNILLFLNLAYMRVRARFQNLHTPALILHSQTPSK